MTEQPSDKVKWYYQPWAVLALLFLVLGPFGLPILYKSPKLSRFWKGALTVLTLLYTYAAIVATFESVKQLSQLLTAALF